MSEHHTHRPTGAETSGRRARRDSRLASTADNPDAARLTGEKPPGWGNLDVPLSVWAGAAEPHRLTAGLVDAFTKPGEFVVTTYHRGWAAAVAHGRRAVVYCGRHHAGAAEAALALIPAGKRGLGQVQVATSQNLAVRLATARSSVDLLIGDWLDAHREGFWASAAGALRPGGYLAMIVGSSDPTVTSQVYSRATETGLAYIQHLIATAPKALDTAVSHQLRGFTPGAKRHVRRHVDVLVYTRPTRQTETSQ